MDEPLTEYGQAPAERQLPDVISKEFIVKGGRRSFRLFDTKISQIECSRIFGGLSYPLPRFLNHIETILDVGANVGAATVFFALHYPEARVFAFEPDPESYRLLAENTSKLPNITTMNIGLHCSDATARLHLGATDPATNSLSCNELVGNESISVTLQTPDQVLEKGGIEAIDLLKVDTEGNEFPILKAFARYLPRTRLIYLEYHDEEARAKIDKLLAPTHGLCWGTITSLHRGELCYILRSEIPDEIQSLRSGERCD